MIKFTMDFKCGILCTFIDELKLYCKFNIIKIEYDYCYVGSCDRHYFVKFEGTRKDIINLQNWIRVYRKEK